MNDEGLVVGIDHIPELVNLSKENISKSNKKLLDEGKIILDVSDGRYGYKQYAPYNCIYVGAGILNKQFTYFIKIKAASKYLKN